VFHDLNLAAEYCDKLVVLRDGRVDTLGNAEEVVTVDMIRRVYGVSVTAERNPVSNKPHVVISAGESLPRDSLSS
jgi:iron complex transport system ATP-binding protein